MAKKKPPMSFEKKVKIVLGVFAVVFVIIPLLLLMIDHFTGFFPFIRGFDHNDSDFWRLSSLHVPWHMIG